MAGMDYDSMDQVVQTGQDVYSVVNDAELERQMIEAADNIEFD